MCRAYFRYWSYSNQQNKNSYPLYIHLSGEKNPNSQPIFSPIPSRLCLFSLGLFNSGLSRGLKNSSRSPVFLWDLMGDLEVLCLCPLRFFWDSDLFQWRGISDWEEMGECGGWNNKHWVKILFWKGMHYCERDKAFRHVSNVSGRPQLN